MSEQSNWQKDMGRCIFNNMGECLAQIPEACVCQKIPKTIYEEHERAKTP
jgi:hypothetical protein